MCWFLTIVLVLSHTAAAQGLAAAKLAEPVPNEVATPLKALLATSGTRVTVGDKTVDFWLVQALPLQAGASGAANWTQVPEGSLVGAVRLSAPFQDIRGRTIKAGVYTLRYGIQPANGDHLGASPFRDFLLLGPAALDTQEAPLGHDGVVDLSKASTGISHPGILSLDPPTAAGEPLRVVANAEGHKAIILEVPVSVGGKTTGALRFGVILIGRIDA